MENKYIEIIKNCFSDSSQYLAFLKNLQTNYFNLKSEFWMRNFLLEFLNDKLPEGQKAFAEYPKCENNRRYDLSIFDKKKSNDDFICIELKYQFPYDFRVKKVNEKIEQDMKGIKNKKGADIFILIVAEWSASNDPLKEWNIKHQLSKYQNKKNDDWKKDVNNLLTCKYTSRDDWTVKTDIVKYHHFCCYGKK